MTPRRLPGALGAFLVRRGLRPRPVFACSRSISFDASAFVRSWFCFAGLWRPMPDGGAAFTLLTTEPGPDVAPIHDRQMVVLERSDWSAWLELTGNEAELLRALSAGSLNIEQVR